MTETSKPFTYGSVCSGIEATTAAWHPLGWKPSFFSEIEAFPRAVLKHHYPSVALHGDFTTIKTGEYEPIDLLVGGTPCQSFSVAGLRGGLSDDRGNLALEFLRLAQRLRPRWLVWENVPGVLSSGGGRDFGSILGGLVELGYGFAYRILDAQFFGVPQHRRRVFVVAYLGDARPARAVLFERHSLQGHSAPRRSQGEEVAGTFTSRAKSGGWGTSVDLASSGYMRPVNTSTEGSENCLLSKSNQSLDPTMETYIAHTLTSSPSTGRSPNEDANLLPVAMRMREGCAGGGKGPLLSEDQSLTLASATNDQVLFTPVGIEGEDTGFALRANPSASGDKGDGGVNTTMVIAAPVCPTIGASGAGFSRPGNSRTETEAVVSMGMKVRRLTPVECERLQGFPDNFTMVPYRGKPSTECPDGPRYKALGNSMAVPVMQWIGERIQMVEDILQSGKVGGIK